MSSPDIYWFFYWLCYLGLWLLELFCVKQQVILLLRNEISLLPQSAVGHLQT